MTQPETLRAGGRQRERTVYQLACVGLRITKKTPESGFENKNVCDLYKKVQREVVPGTF